MEMYMIETSKHMMYHCLLILTDGIIHDLRETVDRIVKGADMNSGKFKQRFDCFNMGLLVIEYHYSGDR